MLAFEKSVANSEPKFTLEIIYLLSGSINLHPYPYQSQPCLLLNSFKMCISGAVSKAISCLRLLGTLSDHDSQFKDEERGSEKQCDYLQLYIL